MKKLYQVPVITVVKVQTTTMIAASTKVGVSETNYDGTTVVESRRGNAFWDDEDDY